MSEMGGSVRDWKAGGSQEIYRKWWYELSGWAAVLGLRKRYRRLYSIQGATGRESAGGGPATSGESAGLAEADCPMLHARTG